MLTDRFLAVPLVIVLLLVFSACIADDTGKISDSEPPPDSLPPDNSSAVAQKILFEFSYINFAWGFQCHGFYVDSAGHAWKYRFERTDEPWQPADPENITEAELLEKYSHNLSLAATLDKGIVDKMAKLIAAASEGELSDRRNIGNDMGSEEYLAYAFDADQETYHPVTLTIYGDWVTENYAAEAKSLVEWLRSIEVNWQH